MINKLINHPFLNKFISPTFIRYGVMAVVVVGIEITSFWILENNLNTNYLVATLISLAIGIVLNWLGSRYFVFGASKRTMHAEFSLVIITSLFGAALQILTVYIAVELLNQAPLIGKSVAIIVTFTWNYVIRKFYIYSS